MLSLFKRDLLLAYRHPIEVLNPLFFFLLVIMLFPLTISSDPQTLSTFAPGIIWIALLFSNLLALDGLFREDYEDGALEQMALQPVSLTWRISEKITAHWVLTSFPMLLLSLIFSKLFIISNQSTAVLFLSILLGSPVMTMVGALGAALTLGLRNRGILLCLLVLPLYLPVLIFAVGAVSDATLGLSVVSHLAFLGSILLLALTFLPWATTAAIRIALES